MASGWHYSVTFENPDSRPPLTARGSLGAGNASGSASRAVRAALATHKGVRYESLAILLYKRVSGRHPEGEVTVAEAGRRGGKARAKNLTPDQIAAIGKAGAEKRWAK